MHSGGFSPGRKKPVRQNPRDQSAVTSTARAPVEAWICEERSRAAHRILVNHYAVKILPARRFHLFITVMTDEML
jgi:hypothetical protein